MPSHAWMYCSDLTGYMDFAYALYNVVTPEAALGTDKGNLIRQLWALHYDRSWETDSYIYYGGSFGGFTSGQPANTIENQNALTFSYALYEIAYDFDGTFPSLNLYAGPLANLVALTDPTPNPKYQTLITEVPELATMALFGLGGLSLVRRKR